MKHTLSVVISAYNEEKKLGTCLSSVAHLADEDRQIIESSCLQKREQFDAQYQQKLWI